MDLKQHFAVIGLGEFGTRICKILVEGGASVIAFDHEPQAVERIKNIVPAAMLVDTTDEEALLKVPLDNIDIAVVAIGNNIEASILTATLLKQRDIPFIIARAVSSLHETVLRRIGANEVLNIEVDSAIQLGKRLIARDKLNTMPLTADCSIREVPLPKMFDGKILESLALKEQFNLKIIALVRLELDIDSIGNPINHTMMYYPDDSFTVKAGDKLFLIGSNEQLDAFRSM